MPLPATYFNRVNDEWLVSSASRLAEGDIVNVRRRNGNASNVRIACLVTIQTTAEGEERYLYRFTNERSSRERAAQIAERISNSTHIEAASRIYATLLQHIAGPITQPFLRFPELTSTQLGMRVVLSHPANVMRVISNLHRFGRHITYGYLGIDGTFNPSLETRNEEVTNDILTEVIYRLRNFNANEFVCGDMQQADESQRVLSQSEQRLAEQLVRRAPMPNSLRQHREPLTGNVTVYDPITGISRTISREAQQEVGFAPGAMRPSRQRAAVTESVDVPVMPRTQNVSSVSAAAERDDGLNEDDFVWPRKEQQT